MEIQEETPIYIEGETQYTLLRYAAMAAKWHEPPRDALDTLTLTAVDMPSMDAVREIATGKVFETTKGAPHVILKLVTDAAHDTESSKTLTHQVEHDVHRLGLRGIRSLAVAKTNDEGHWEFLGLLTFLDPPRPDTKQTIEDAHKRGLPDDYIKSVHGLPLLDVTIKKKPENLGRDYGDMCLAADGFAQVFPEHKYLIVECIREPDMMYLLAME
eukprot:gene41781-51780_t